MKRLILGLFFFFNLSTIVAQSVKIFDGFIDRYPIQVFLNYDSTNVSGWYSYTSVGKPIFIHGEIIDKKLKLEEYDDIVDSFEKKNGLFYLDENYSGIWKTRDQEFRVQFKERLSTIQWELYSQKVIFSQLIKGSNNEIKKKFPIDLYLQVPKDNEKLINLIIPEILDIPRNELSIEDYFNEFVSQNICEYISELNEYTPWFETSLEGKVVSISDDIINYFVTGVYYNGGAQGHGLSQFYIFDLKQLKRLTFDDIFIPEAKRKIAQLLFEIDYGNHTIENFEVNMDNIYVTSNSVGFYFDQDTIDCHACGTFHYFLTFSELKGLLKKVN